MALARLNERYALIGEMLDRATRLRDYVIGNNLGPSSPFVKELDELFQPLCGPATAQEDMMKAIVQVKYGVII